MIECVEYDGINVALECLTCSTVLLTQDKPAIECGNCDWTGTIEDVEVSVKSIPHLFERTMPGEIMPAGECPECGALAHDIAQEERSTDG